MDDYFDEDGAHHWVDEDDPYVELDSFNDDNDQPRSSSDGSSSDCCDVVLPYESEHPNKYVPWAMKQYPPDVIEAWTMLHNCTLSGNQQPAPEFLDKLSKEVLDQPNHEGETLLYMAAFRGHYQMVATLLNAGANPHKGDEFFDMTPLFVAVQNCHIECVNKLLEHVPVNHENTSGFTALFKAAQFGPHKDMLRYLSQPPPHLQEIIHKTRPQNEVILDTLLEKGADVNFTSKVGLTPLLVATRENNVYAVRRLLECGADPMALYKHPISSMKSPLSALDMAAEDESTESLQVILEKCSDNKTLMSRNSAMCLAVRKGNLPCVQALIDTGFDADMGVKLPPAELEQFRSSEDALPILTCIDKVNLDLARYLLSRGASPLYHNLPIAEPFDRCPVYNAFLKSRALLEILLAHCADMKSCPTLRDVHFPIRDPAVWERTPSCFEVILRAGFRLNLDSLNFSDIHLQGRNIEDVARIWWFYTDEIPKDEYLNAILVDFIEMPRSLADLCRVTIRRSISFPKLAKPSTSVRLLPIPQHLQDYVGHM
ncbi:ankyrin repeat and SOCS box protein 2-like [Lytechinus pictus]|uniref:ankyrin repeat and SOCS box protein 2-like n=1 Tax=Lytechinus pictus TaxID=7653 RepID=UPI0030BA2A53